MNKSVKTPPKKTPAGHDFSIPSAALEAAIAKEWAEFETFSPSAMPKSSLLFTAIDQVGDNRANMVEVLMAFVDTDTLCYRSEKPAMQVEQKKQWDPLLAWAGDRFSALWQTTSSIMPLMQSSALHYAVRGELEKLDAVRLTACGMLASGYSSLILALAVLEKKLSAREAFDLSQLEETLQAREWGDDEEALKKRQQMQAEILETSEFLDLLERK